MNFNFKTKLQWERVVLAGILLLLILLNFRWGYFILGNDNYSPEQNPSLSFSRYLTSPAWRAYRGLGVPSDSEQVDIIRSGLFAIFEKIGLPLWFLSQISIWFTFFIGPWSAAHLGKWLYGKMSLSNTPLRLTSKVQYADTLQERLRSTLLLRKKAFLLSGLFYFTNLLTIWLFFSPLKPFVFAWGFLPFFLWQSQKFLEKTSLKTFFPFLFSLLCLTTSAIIPTIFLVEVMAIIIFYLFFCLLGTRPKKAIALFCFFIVFQLFWLMPFTFYVASNAEHLQNSFINRKITPNTILTEAKRNNLFNLLRFHSFWLDTRKDNQEFLFSHSPTYQFNKFFLLLSWIVPMAAFLGIVILILKKKRRAWPLIFLLVGGAWIIKGPNPPLSFIFIFLQNNIPLFKQVFRWSSSKFWPFLTLSLPFLASFSIIFLTRSLPKLIKNLLFVFVIVSQLIFIFPFWQKEIINDRDWVKIPPVYFELKDFLEKTDPQGRVYAAPEANMLYFRNHDWGFYGSVFLSYLLPNPVLEKALTVGSPENEEAYFTLVNAYYSEKPDLFAETLRTYKVNWLVSDKSLTSKDSGYRYNWRINEKMVEQNPNLEKIWEKDFLTLYSVKNQPAQSQELVYWNHDWLSLQKARLLGSEKPQFLSGQDQFSGTIYPLLTEIETIESLKDGLILAHTYQGKDDNYNFNIPDNWQDLPVFGEFNSSEKAIIFRPSIPQIWQNERLVFGSEIFEGFRINITDQTKFVTVGDLVWDFRKEPQKVFDLAYRGFQTNPVGIWQNKVKTITGENFLALEKPSVIKLDLTIKAETPGWYNLCLESTLLRQCMNKEVSFWAEPVPQSVGLLLEYAFPGQDKITLWLPEEADFKIEKASLYQSFKRVSNKAFIPVKADLSPQALSLKAQDQLKIKIPLIAGRDSYYWSPSQDSSSILEIFTSGEVVAKDKRLLVSAQEESAGVYFKFSPLHKSNSLMLVSMGAKNLQGVPLDVNFGDTKQEYKLFTERLAFEKESTILTSFITPEELHNYLLEVYLYGQGKIPSLNQLNFLLFQPLPLPWAQIKLMPENPEPVPEIIATNQTYHQYWQGVDKVKINGWEQGFTTHNSQLTTQFWPNYLTWAGYGLNITLIGGVILFLKQKLFSRRPRVSSFARS